MHILFKCPWDISQDESYLLNYRANLNTFKRIEILQNMLSNISGIKLGIINKTITEKSPSTQK